MTFDKTQRYKPVEETVGPGNYNTDKAHSLTKSKSQAAIIDKTKRPNSFAAKAQDGSAGPGQYNDGIRFNSSVKSFRIGEKRTEIPKESMGPGAYDPDKADRMTKPKIKNIDLGKSPSRPK